MNCELLKEFFGPASFGICTVCVILQMISITALAAAFLYMMKTGNRQKTINIVKAGAFSAYANGIIAVAVCVIYRMYTGKLLIVPAIQPLPHICIFYKDDFSSFRKHPISSNSVVLPIIVYFLRIAKLFFHILTDCPSDRLSGETAFLFRCR